MSIEFRERPTVEHVFVQLGRDWTLLVRRGAGARPGVRL